eukprot:Em0013g953a
MKRRSADVEFDDPAGGSTGVGTSTDTMSGVTDGGKDKQGGAPSAGNSCTNKPLKTTIATKDMHFMEQVEQVCRIPQEVSLVLPYPTMQAQQVLQSWKMSVFKGFTPEEPSMRLYVKNLAKNVTEKLKKNSPIPTSIVFIVFDNQFLLISSPCRYVVMLLLANDFRRKRRSYTWLVVNSMFAQYLGIQLIKSSFGNIRRPFDYTIYDYEAFPEENFNEYEDSTQQDEPQYDDEDDNDEDNDDDDDGGD